MHDSELVFQKCSVFLRFHNQNRLVNKYRRVLYSDNCSVVEMQTCLVLDNKKVKSQAAHLGAISNIIAPSDISYFHMDPQHQREVVSKYYGETLKSSSDLRTSACCPVDAVPAAHRKILSQLHPQVVSKFYGCGSPIPQHLNGATVLDLGCGTGRDAYLASALVGSTGSVVGVDMTEEQLKVARAFQEYHAKAFFGDPKLSNVDFREAYIEDLSSVDISDNSIDVVISNCVCNLSPDKSKVFCEVFRVLREGGEFYFSDVYADRRLSDEATKHPVLISECLGGALYLEDFRRIMKDAGFNEPRVVSFAPVELVDTALIPLVPDVNFYSVTFRAFKVSDMEDRREDYSQKATFKPSGCNTDDCTFKLDIDNVFEANIAQCIDLNTANILQSSRFRGLFTISEQRAHRGLFQRLSNAPDTTASLDCFRPVRWCTEANNEKASDGTGKSPTNGCSKPAKSSSTGISISSVVNEEEIASSSSKSTKTSCCGGGSSGAC